MIAGRETAGFGLLPALPNVCRSPDARRRLVRAAGWLFCEALAKEGLAGPHRSQHADFEDDGLFVHCVCVCSCGGRALCTTAARGLLLRAQKCCLERVVYIWYELALSCLI